MWLEQLRRFWAQRLDALVTELARGKAGRRVDGAGRPRVEPRPGVEDPTSGEDEHPR